MKPYEYIEGITDADYAFKAFGKNLNELFENAGIALVNAMVKPKSVGKTIKKEINLESDSVEKLLFDFLEEIVYLKDAESLMVNSITAEVKEAKDKFSVEAQIFGEELNLEKHELITDVKSVTYHHYKVEKTSNGWEATVVIDV